MSERFVFRMQLKAGQAAEYGRRHDEIWPELVSLLHDVGLSNYSIHLEEETGLLIGVLDRIDGHKMDDLPSHPVMQKWWAHMADIMDVEDDGAPVTIPLPRVFHLP